MQQHITVDELLAIIGSKEVQLVKLQTQLAHLQQVADDLRDQLEAKNGHALADPVR